eukprot:6490607-Amphidinium_carterae.2
MLAARIPEFGQVFEEATKLVAERFPQGVPATTACEDGEPPPKRPHLSGAGVYSTQYTTQKDEDEDMETPQLEEPPLRSDERERMDPTQQEPPPRSVERERSPRRG